MLAQAAEKYLKLLSKMEWWLTCAAFILLALVLFFDVFMRTVLGNGLVWSHQFAVYANLVLSLVAIGLASSSGSHLRPRFADRWFPQRWEPILVKLQSLTSALIFLGFSLLAMQLVLESVALNELSTVLQVPVWPLQSLLPLVFFLAFSRYSVFFLYPHLSPQSIEQELME